jgi:hypothetical protein
MADAPPIITCPRCEKKFKGKVELFGKRIRCPGCSKPFVVPSPDSKIDEKDLKNILDFKEDDDVKAAEEIKKGIQIPMGRRFFEDDGPAQYDVTHEDDIPRCPNCANPLESADAVVCLYCGYNTSTRTWGKTKKVLQSTSGDQVMWLLPAFICAFVIFLQMIGCLYYCLILPEQLGENWWNWVTHESMRMWLVILNLFIMWPLGYIAYSRLVVNPTPPEKEAD